MSGRAESWLETSGSKAESAPYIKKPLFLCTLQSKMILSFERTTIVVRFFSVVNGNHSMISYDCNIPLDSILIECAVLLEK